MTKPDVSIVVCTFNRCGQLEAALRDLVRQDTQTVSLGYEVVVVASGVVTWTGRQAGYGEMIEVSHGDGFVTRYAHNKQNLVKAGDMVTKGESIALMGSTGRSTGPHVHIEVLYDGKQVNPNKYLHN